MQSKWRPGQHGCITFNLMNVTDAFNAFMVDLHQIFIFMKIFNPQNKVPVSAGAQDTRNVATVHQCFSTMPVL
jgi:hypothetical protein